MKIFELYEMAFLAGEWKFTPNPAVLLDIFKNLTKETTLENDLTVKQADDKFGLFRDGTLLSFAQIKNTAINGAEFREVLVIYTPKENRRMGYSTIVLYALKELSSIPLLFDNAIFNDGWSLLQSIASGHNDKFQSIHVLNKATGQTSSFKNMSPSKEEAFIIENDDMGFYKDCALGRIYFNMFESIR